MKMKKIGQEGVRVQNFTMQIHHWLHNSWKMCAGLWIVGLVKDREIERCM